MQGFRSRRLRRPGGCWSRLRALRAVRRGGKVRMMWWEGNRWSEKSRVDDVGLFDCRLGLYAFRSLPGNAASRKEYGYVERVEAKYVKLQGPVTSIGGAARCHGKTATSIHSTPRSDCRHGIGIQCINLNCQQYAAIINEIKSLNLTLGRELLLFLVLAAHLRCLLRI